MGLSFILMTPWNHGIAFQPRRADAGCRSSLPSALLTACFQRATLGHGANHRALIRLRQCPVLEVLGLYDLRRPLRTYPRTAWRHTTGALDNGTTSRGRGRGRDSGRDRGSSTLLTQWILTLASPRRAGGDRVGRHVADVLVVATERGREMLRGRAVLDPLTPLSTPPWPRAPAALRRHSPSHE